MEGYSLGINKDILSIYLLCDQEKVSGQRRK